MNSRRVWIGGLISAVTGAAMGALGPVLMDPAHFKGIMAVKAAAGPALLVTLAYLSKSPLPGFNTNQEPPKDAPK